MDDLALALEHVGGVGAGHEHGAWLGRLLDAELRSGAAELAWLLTAAAVAALVEAGRGTPPRAGERAGALLLEVPADARGDADLAALAFDEHVRPVDRLRPRGL